MDRSLLVLLSLLMLGLAPTAKATAPCDRPHIQAHLAEVLAELEAAEVGHLSTTQRANRQRHIAELATYRQACAFPRAKALSESHGLTTMHGPATSASEQPRAHVVYPRLAPVFVDDADVHCAVGHLVAQDGRRELVERVRTTNNGASIAELSDDAELGQWLLDAGLTWHEAARIQPGYCYSPSGCLCAGLYPAAPSVAEGTIIEESADDGTAKMRVVRVHGSAFTDVGDTLDVHRADGDYVGRQALAIVRGALLTTQVNRLRPWWYEMEDGTFTCESSNGSRPPQTVTVPVDVYVDALMSQNCRVELGKYDSKLKQQRCVGGDESFCAGASPSGWPLLLMASCLGWLVARRSA